MKIIQGQVVKVIAGYYDVRTDDQIFRVRGSGNLRNTNNTPVVGDFVEFAVDGLLTKILPRKNFLERPKVANIDQVIIVTSLVEPDFSSFLLHKILAVVEFKDIKPIIIFTKKDKSKYSYLDLYKNQGYEAYEISNLTPESLIHLRDIFRNKISVFTGQTGAGKSSTINSLTGLSLETQEISKALGRGKHTTRVVEIISFLGGGIIDTPGFSSFDLKLTKLELANSFHDFKILSTKCKFRSCIHFHEELKDCAVKRAVEEKNIDIQRYRDYLKLLNQILGLAS